MTDNITDQIDLCIVSVCRRNFVLDPENKLPIRNKQMVVPRVLHFHVRVHRYYDVTPRHSCPEQPRFDQSQRVIGSNNTNFISKYRAAVIIQKLLEISWCIKNK